jgi:hypothetical protein
MLTVETAANRTIETADEVARVGKATAAARDNAIRGQVDQFFQKLWVRNRMSESPCASVLKSRQPGRESV